MLHKMIQQYLDKDHAKIEELFQQFQSHKSSDFPKSKEYFSGFRSALKRHMEIEEEILFPIFETQTGLNDMGPTSIIRHEHKEIIKSLEALHEKILHNNPPGDEEVGGFIKFFKEHTHKEEHLIYPMFDELLTDEESKRIMGKIENISADRHKGCSCPEKS